MHVMHHFSLSGRSIPLEGLFQRKWLFFFEGLILRKGYSLGWAIPWSGWMIIFWHVFSQLKTFKTCSLVKLTTLLEKNKKIYAIKELFQGCVLCILKLSNKILHYDSTTIVHILTLSFWGNCCLCLRFLDLDTAISVVDGSLGMLLERGSTYSTQQVGIKYLTCLH